MKSFINFCGMLLAVGFIAALLIFMAPEKISPIIGYFSNLGFSTPDCSDERTTNLLFELFSKQISEIADKGHLSIDDFQLRGITTVASENQNGRFYPTKFTCQAYINVNLSPKALDAISDLRKQRQTAENPFVQAMGLGMFFPNMELLESAAEINIENGSISQSFQYTTQMDDALEYQSVSASGIKPVATVIAFLSANGIPLEPVVHDPPSALVRSTPDDVTPSPKDEFLTYGKNSVKIHYDNRKSLFGNSAFANERKIVENDYVALYKTFPNKNNPQIVFIAEDCGGSACSSSSLTLVDLTISPPITQDSFCVPYDSLVMGPKDDLVKIAYSDDNIKIDSEDCRENKLGDTLQVAYQWCKMAASNTIGSQMGLYYFPKRNRCVTGSAIKLLLRTPNTAVPLSENI